MLGREGAVLILTEKSLRKTNCQNGDTVQSILMIHSRKMDLNGKDAGVVLDGIILTKN
jgi:hypothetical protein